LILALFLTLVFTGVKNNTFFDASMGNIAIAASVEKQANPSTQKVLPQSDSKKNVTEPSSTDKKERGGFQYYLFRFLMAMLGVIVSSAAIFLGLKLYQKFVLKKGLSSDEKDYENTLESPKDFKEAINSFLSKTDK